MKKNKIKDEAFALGTALSLDDEDFKVGFNFCDKDENGKVFILYIIFLLYYFLNGTNLFKNDKNLR